MSNKNLEPQIKVTTIELGPLGYTANPNASIGYKAPEQESRAAEIHQFTQEYIKSGEGLVALRRTDDGCIDGRPTAAEFPESHIAGSRNIADYERAKVAGGGYITSFAMRLGAGIREESTMREEFVAHVDSLTASDVYCGAHTGEHEDENSAKTDCGANDKFTEITENGVALSEQIKGTTKSALELAGIEFDEATFEAVIENWKAAHDATGYFADSTGLDRLKGIAERQQAWVDKVPEEEPISVTRHLKGDHNEKYFLLNYIPGTTFSQQLLRNALAERFGEIREEEQPQVFVADVPRIVELTNATVGQELHNRALYAGIAFQSATGATLTDGTLPMFAYLPAAA